MVDGSQQVVRVAVDRIQPDPRSPNRMSDETREALRANIGATGHSLPLVLRPGPDPDTYICVDGHHRLAALVELGYADVDALIWDIDAQEAALLLASLNRLRGEDHPGKRAALLRELSEQIPIEELARLLPEDAETIAATLADLEFDVVAELARLESAQASALAELPVAYAFAVDPADVAVVDAALARAAAGCQGANQRGQAFVRLATAYLEAADA